MSRFSLLLWCALAAFLLDQGSKYLVVHHMNLIAIGAIDVWPPYLNFRMGWNRGINFGLFAGYSEALRWALIAVALAIVGGLIWWLRRARQGPWVMISAGLLVGGALGNVVDRVLYGAVADFLNMSCCGIQNPFTFNVADIAIFAGAIGLVIFVRDEKNSA